MRRLNAHAPLLIVMAIVALAGGCAAGRAADELTAINHCASDTECSDFGGVCDLELAACVSMSANVSETLVVTVLDPQLGLAGEHRFELEESGVADLFDLSVAEPVLFNGLVVDRREEDGESFVPARLTFRRRSQFEDLSPEPIYAEATENASEGDGGTLFNYQLRLSPGDYEIEVEPQQEAGAPTSVQRLYPMRRSCTIPSDDCDADFEYISDSGVIESVVHGPGGGPIGGVRIYALDANDGRRISSVAVTECDPDSDPVDCGRFTLVVHEDIDEFRLHLSGSQDNPFLPVLELGPYSFGQDDDNDDNRVDIDDGEIEVLAFSAHEPAVLYNAVVEGVGRDGAIRPVVGATLQLVSVIDDQWTTTDGVFELEATTNEVGAVMAVMEGLRDLESDLGIWLVPGEYDVTINPPIESEYATFGTRIVVETPGEGDLPIQETITVGARSLIEGVVTSPDGRLVSQVQVEAVNHEGGRYVAVSDEVGAYSMFVDQATYDLIFVPPDNDMLSWSRVVGASALSDLSLDVTVGWGTPIEGEVRRSASGEPVESAIVEGFVVREGDPDGGRPFLVPIGRSRTLGDGRFVFLLPEHDTF